MHKFFICLMIGVWAVAIGCGKSSSTPVQPASASPSSAHPNDPIALIAYEFLDAVRASNNDAARARLTPLAVRRMAELGMDFLLPISESAQFSVSKADYIEDDIAAVDTVWTETDANGQVQREELTVVLKRNDGQWGIMAVLAGMGSNQEPDGIDFEKPNQPFNFAALAEGPSPNGNAVPQQASRPLAQDPFRQ